MVDLDRRKTTSLYRTVARLLEENDIDKEGAAEILRMIREAEELRDLPEDEKPYIPEEERRIRADFETNYREPEERGPGGFGTYHENYEEEDAAAAAAEAAKTK